MSCDQYADAIVDHACGAELADEAAAHLRACAACLRLFEEQRLALQSLDGELQKALAIDPSAWFEAQTLSAIQRSPTRRRTLRWLPAVAAVAALLILGTLVAVRHGNRQAPDRHEVAARPIASPAKVAEHEPVSSGAPRHREREAVVARQQRGPTKPDVASVTPQAQAIDKYLSLLRRGAIDASSLADSNPDATAIAAPDDLVIAPISVEALPAINVERGIGPAVDQYGIK